MVCKIFVLYKYSFNFPLSNLLSVLRGIDKGAERKAAMHRTCLTVLVVLWAAGDYRLTRAQEVNNDDVDVSRIRIVAAAMATRGHWRVALKGEKGSCSPWDGHKIPLRDAEGKTKHRVERQDACTSPEMRSNEAGEVVNEAGKAGNGECLVQSGGDTERNVEEAKKDPVRSMHLRNEDILKMCERLGNALPPPSSQLRAGAPEHDGLKVLHVTRETPEDTLRSDDENAGVASTVGSGARGGSLDALLEHLEDDTVPNPAASPASSHGLLDQLFTPSVRFSLMSPLAIAFSLAGAVGYVAQYFIFHMLHLLLPLSLRGSDRAVGAVVIMSMIASVPVKFVVTKIAADVLGSGDRVTTARFALVCFLTAFLSPLLVCVRLSCLQSVLLVSTPFAILPQEVPISLETS